jgi:hypothetical protein
MAHALSNDNEHTNHNVPTLEYELENEDMPDTENENVEALEITDDTTDTNKEIPYSDQYFQLGDHVYKWCSFAGDSRPFSTSWHNNGNRW